MAGASNETVALIAAGGATAGAFVGAATGGVVDFVLARITEGRKAKAGARLLCTDLSTAASRVKAAADDRRWWPFYDMPLTSWDRYQDVLATRLKPADIDVVLQSVVEIRELSDKMARAPDPPTGEVAKRLGDKSVEALRIVLQNATAAYNALAATAEQEPAQGVLHG